MGIDNSLPMLDLKLTENENRIERDIYHKSTHTDQNLQWTSHHPVQQKLGIVRTSLYWVNTLISDEGRSERVKDKVIGGLRNCGYPKWALKESKPGVVVKR